MKKKVKYLNGFKTSVSKTTNRFSIFFAIKNVKLINLFIMKSGQKKFGFYNIQWYDILIKATPQVEEYHAIIANVVQMNWKKASEFLCSYCTDSFLITFNHLAPVTFYYVFIVEKNLIHCAGRTKVREQKPCNTIRIMNIFISFAHLIQ